MSQSNYAYLLTAAAIIAPIAAYLVMTRCKCACGGGGGEGEEEKTDRPKAQIDPQEFTKFELIKKEHVTHNTCLYRFRLPDANRPLGLQPGQHIQIRAIVNNNNNSTSEEVIKPYTPVSLASVCGHFDLLIKTYPEGRVSQFMAKLNIGDAVEMRGPKGAFKFAINMAPKVGMIAGGTGITPILSVIRAMLEDPQDRTIMTLLFANRTSEDVLLEKELNDLQRQHPDRFKVHYTVDEPDEKWDGLTGRVTAEMMRSVGIPACDGDKGVIFMCGPPPMMTAMVGELAQLGYTVPPTQEGSRIFKF